MVSSVSHLALGLLPFIAQLVEAQVAGQCSGQSCETAALAATTPNGPPTIQPKGGNAAGNRCIAKVLGQIGAPVPKYLPGGTDVGGGSSTGKLGGGLLGKGKGKGAYVDMTTNEKQIDLDKFFEQWANVTPNTMENSVETGFKEDEGLERRQGCKANTLIYARGTTETGELGLTVGPALKRALTGWNVQGVKTTDGYAADLPGIYCLGLPGGQGCVKKINALAAKCPNTKIVLSGYSQGAMVARFCAAWADPAAQKLIKGIATFGDPFNGAEVKGVPKNKVKVWCNKGDGVCKGEFSIGAAHLSYTAGSTSAAVTWIKSVVNG